MKKHTTSTAAAASGLEFDALVSGRLVRRLAPASNDLA